MKRHRFILLTTVIKRQKTKETVNCSDNNNCIPIESGENEEIVRVYGEFNNDDLANCDPEI